MGNQFHLKSAEAVYRSGQLLSRRFVKSAVKMRLFEEKSGVSISIYAERRLRAAS